MKNKLQNLLACLGLIFAIVLNGNSQIPLTLVTTDDLEGNCGGSYYFIDETEYDWSEYIALVYKDGEYQIGWSLAVFIGEPFPACAGKYVVELKGPDAYDHIAGLHYPTGCFTGRSVSFTIKGACEIETNPLVTGICEGEEDELKTITLDIEGGEEPYFISWSTGEYGNSIETMDHGLYTVTVEDKNGCSISDNIIVDNNGSDFGYTYEVIPLQGGFPGEVNITFYNNYPPLNVTAPLSLLDNSFSPTWTVNSGEVITTNYWIPPALNPVEFIVTNNSGCTETVSVTLLNCWPFFNPLFSVGPVFAGDDLEIDINNIQGGLPPYDISVKRVRKNNIEPDFEDWQSTTTTEASSLNIPVPVEGKYHVTITDQCKNIFKKELYFTNGSKCDYEISNSENENTHYYTPAKGNNYKITFEAICGCNDKCNALIFDKDPFIDIKNKNIFTGWGDVIITWPVIPGYQNDDNSLTTRYYWQNGSLKHTGREHFSLGEYLNDKTEPIELVVKVNYTGIDCIVEIPMTFSPTESVTQLNFDEANKVTSSGYQTQLEFHDVWDDGFFKESLVLNSQCKDCYTSSEGILINEVCGGVEDVIAFIYSPNNFENPCNGGGKITAYNYDSFNNVSSQEIEIPAGTAVKSYDLPIIGAMYNTNISTCEEGGGCLFSSDNVFDFPLINNDGETYLILANYCKSGLEVIDMDNDGVHDPWDNCPLISNPAQWDYDNDGVGDACDNCKKEYNPGQEDEDQDGKGNVCDTWDIEIIITGNSGNSNTNDADSDGIIDIEDNCINTPNNDQTDSDDNGIGDACDCQTKTVMSFAGVCYEQMICPDEDPVDIEGTAEQCVKFLSSSPNPFYGHTIIKWEVPNSGSVQLRFFEAVNGWEIGDPLFTTAMEVQSGINIFTLLQQDHLDGYVGPIIRRLTYAGDQLGSAQVFANGLYADNGLKQDSDESSSRNDQNISFSANIFPNPTSNSITVNSETTIKDILLYSIDGRMVLKFADLKKDLVNLSLEELDSGLYLMQIISTDNISLIKKVIIEK